MVTAYDGMILSFGGGVNSTALAIWLISQGWQGEIVFADTGCEWPDTMCFLDYFEAEYLKPRGYGLVRLGPKQRQGHDAVLGLNSLIDYCEKRSVIPLASVRWCTICWKVEPVGVYAAGRPQLLGIAAEEARRKPDAIRPLVDWGIDRAGCVRIIQEAGLSVPRKSGCYICPFQRVAQWRELWERYPELYARAECLESAASDRTGRTITLDPSGRYTLADLRLKFESQLEMFDTDEYLSYQPCVCTV